MAEPLDNLPDESQLQAPKTLRDDLAALFGSSPTVPSEVDAAILGRARRHLGGTQPGAAVPHDRRVRRMVRWAAVAAAAAALLVVAGIQAVRHGEPRAASKPAVTVAAKTAPPASEDINHDGRVDILDAFLLARRLESPARPTAEWDFTRDGVVDRRDVDAVAMSAVRLDKGTLH